LVNFCGRSGGIDTKGWAVMTEDCIIENVAKSLFERRLAYANTFGRVSHTWENIDEKSRAYWLDLANVAYILVIKAIRHLSEDIIDVGQEHIPISSELATQEARESVILVWQSILDEMLKHNRIVK
jgi:hypothetical protein